MALRIGDTIPDFEAETTDGPIRFHDWIGADWVILFSHPADFTPVCTTEFADTANLVEELARRGAKAIGLSVDSLERHMGWRADILELTGRGRLGFPIIADHDLSIAKRLDMLPPEARLSTPRLPEETAAVRRTFIIDPDKRIRLSMYYPNEVGRNFFEVMRVLDALLINARTGLEAPSCWAPGDDLVVAPGMTTEEAMSRYGEVEVVYPYLRKVRYPD